jgi:hypothetical protein
MDIQSEKQEWQSLATDRGMMIDSSRVEMERKQFRQFVSICGSRQSEPNEGIWSKRKPTCRNIERSGEIGSFLVTKREEELGGKQDSLIV